MLSLFDDGAHPPCPDPFNLADYVLNQGASGRVAADDAPALDLLGPDHVESWTYGALRQAVLGTGTGLLGEGLEPGDRVLLRLGNAPLFPIAYLGAIAVGLVPVPTSSQLTDPEVQRMIDELAPRAILRDPAVASPDHPREIPADSLRQMQSLPPCKFAYGAPDRPAYIVYTSGTGGNPRAVVHAHRAIWARQMMIRHWYDLGADDRLMHAGAFNWTFTLGTGLMDPWSMGATSLIPRAGTALEALPDLMAHHRATLVAAAPGVYRKMLKSRALPKMPSLRHALSAGEKLPAPLAADWQATTGTPIYEAFGMSECSTFISASPTNPAPVSALGRPQPGRRIAVLDDTGAPVPLDTPGIIAIDQSDPGLMIGYFNAPEATKARLCNGWFLTGDRGTMSHDGLIHYLGRNDDMMNAGGYRVSPMEVEATLMRHPGLTQIAVAAVPVAQDTQIIAAFFNGAEDVTADTLLAFANQHLARYKQPRAYVRVDQLPTGANGKLLRRALPDLYTRLMQRTPT
ncbi:class I adenylate-forming enzyme family protein [Phaeobacter italicus]|uniref:class I adenylate-forming enzyme family protein n=1 Tax=Phaeobacter italicus TaxID=481446 RepID=UPI00232DF42D|nr:class I adenylate-forming enzyme family protein [Phaeobacter italicus]